MKSSMPQTKKKEIKELHQLNFFSPFFCVIAAIKPIYSVNKQNWFYFVRS
jgi:hypothetical protein